MVKPFNKSNEYCSQTYKTGESGVYKVDVINVQCTGSDTVQLTITPVPQITNSALTKSICTGEIVGDTLLSNVPGTMFHWTASLTSGNITGFSADSGLVINQVLVNPGNSPGVVTYHVVPKVGQCTGEAVDFMVTVNPGASVGVTIVTTVTSVCSGTSVTFTTVATNQGTTPVYQWTVNGINSGFNSPVFNYIPADGDVVQCQLTSSNTVCTSNNPAMSNEVIMEVVPLQLVSVTIVTPVTSICTGATATFTATSLNAGNNPFYEWQVNGNNLGPNSPVFSYQPANGDVVSCWVSSSATCITGSPAASNGITMEVLTSQQVSVTIVTNVTGFCEGNPVSFQASPVNVGANPSYQWKVNGVNQGSNSNIFSYVPQPGDSVRCLVISNLSCVSNNPASSNKIILYPSPKPVVTFCPCFDTITTVNAKPFRLRGGNPVGGVYSGAGVNSLTGVFNPGVAGVGSHLITYSYTNVYGCEASVKRQISNANYGAFTCGNNLVDIRDGTVYPTVQIGAQCWMASNLHFGLHISHLTSQTDNCVAEYYTPTGQQLYRTPPRPPLEGEGVDLSKIAMLFFGSNTHPNDLGNPYSLPYKGRAGVGSLKTTLYQWDELMQYQTDEAVQGLCPPGWHIPSQTEWNTLLNFYQGAGRAGKPLQDTLINGFGALMSGVYYSQSFLNYEDFATMLWSSTPAGNDRALAFGMNVWNFPVSLYPAGRGNGFGAGCVKD